MRLLCLGEQVSLVRRIYRRASESVSELIPPIEWDQIEDVSFYPGRATTQNNRSKTAISAERTDVMRYLFEKEGTVEIPEMTLMWWNAGRQKLYKRTLAARSITVQPNPDLGMLSSIKDSLDAQMLADVEEAEDTEFEFLGLNWRQLAILIFVIIIAGRLLWKVVVRLLALQKRRREAYLYSERYYFDKLLSALGKDETSRLNAFYHWIDCLDLEEYSYNYFSQKWLPDFPASMPTTRHAWRTARSAYLNRVERRSVGDWINP